MDSLLSLYRVRNVDFFLLLGSCDTVTEARKQSGISRDHARKLVKLWREAGWIMVYDASYDYTKSGALMVKSFHDIGWCIGKA